MMLKFKEPAYDIIKHTAMPYVSTETLVVVVLCVLESQMSLKAMVSCDFC